MDGFMPEFINHHSALILLGLLLGTLCFVGWVKRNNRKVLIVVAAVGLVFALIFLSATDGRSAVSSVAEFDSVIGSGEPVVVQFYSDT